MKASVFVAAMFAVLMSTATVVSLTSNSIFLGEALIFGSLLGLIPAAIASNKGKNFFTWWVYGWCIWIVAIIHAFCLAQTPVIVHIGYENSISPQYAIAPPPPNWALARQAAVRNAPADIEAVLREWKRCPLCVETIRIEARVCYKCQRQIG